MNSSSALSPMFLPFRPAGVGWVAYHETEPTTGIYGLAMTWRSSNGGLRWVAVLDRSSEGRVTYSGRLGEQEDLTGVISMAVRGPRSPMAEGAIFEMLLPHPNGDKARQAFSGDLPSLEDHMGKARRAAREAYLRPAMRSAFLACLEHGSASVQWIESLRQRTHIPMWPAVTLAVSSPSLASMVLGNEPSLMAKPDPMAAIRQRWPGLTDGHLRRLPAGQKGLPVVAAHRAARPCLDLLSETPVDWFPPSGDWSSFIGCAKALRAVANACHEDVSVGALASASKGDWDGFLKRLHRAAGILWKDNHGLGLVRKGEDCRDPVGALANGLILPLIAHLGTSETVTTIEDGLASDMVPSRSSPRDVMKIAWMAASRLLYGEKSAVAILETSREWHARQDRMEADIRGDGGNACWPALFDGAFLDGDISISCIDNYADLRAEGRAGFDDDGVMGLDHCVASRLPEMLSGQSHVLSVRRIEADGSSSRLSTCQISARMMGNGNVLAEVEEHRGRENEDPDTDAEGAVRKLIKAFETGEIPASREALSTARQGHGLAEHCGYDWRDASALSNAMQAWRPFLPRWTRDLGIEEFHQALIERQVFQADHLPFQEEADQVGARP